MKAVAAAFLACSVAVAAAEPPIKALPPTSTALAVPRAGEASGKASWPALPLVLEPRGQARRDATFLLGDGDRLRRSGRWKEARKEWLAAADAYQRAEDPIGVSEAYRRLGDSYALGSDLDKGEHRIFLEYYVKGMLAAADAFEASTRKASPRDAEALSQADALLGKALILRESKSCAQALPMFGEAESLYRRAGMAVGEIRSMLLRAPCLDGSDLELTAMLTTVAELLEALPLKSHDLKLAADALFQKGRWREAREIYQEMLCRAEQAEDASGVASALLDLGEVQAAQGDISEAEVNLQRSLNILPLLDEDGRRDREGRARESLGRVFFEGGRLDAGTEELRKALEVWRRSGQPDREAVSLGRLASGLAKNGELVAALSALDEAEALRHFLPYDPESEGDLSTVKASLLSAQGKFQEAFKLLYRAEDLYRQGGLSLKMEAVGNDILRLQNFLGRSGGDLDASPKEPERDLRSQPNLMTQIEILQRFQTLDANGKHQEAIELCHQLLRSFAQSGNREGEALTRALLAVTYLEIGRGKEAKEELGKANLLLAQGVGAGAAPTPLQGLISQATILARAFERMEGTQGAPSQGSGHEVSERPFGEIGNGLREDIHDLEGLRSGTDLDSISQALKPLERVASGDLEGAFRGMSEIISSFDRWGRGLTLSELKTPFFDRWFGMYSMGVDLSLVTGRPEVAFRYAEEVRARAFADQIGNQRIDARQGADPELLQAERRLRLQRFRLASDIHAEQQKSVAEQSSERLASLQRSLERVDKDYEELRIRLKATNPEYSAFVSVDPIDLSEIQHQVLDGRTTLIEYFLTYQNEGSANGAIAFVIDREHFTMVRLPVTTGDLKSRVTELRSLIEAHEPIASQATALYRDLFAPLAPYVRNRNLVIVPHNILHFLPFAALWDGKGYLGDKYALSYSPSATALKFARARKAAAAGPILAAGDPDGSLKYADTESRAAARLYGAEPLLGRAATEGAVVARAGQAGILHLAAHAVLNPVNPLLTRIELAPDGEHDGNLEMHEVFGLDLSKTGLVVLSACSTQMGRLSAGDELEGLTRAFLYAGTPAVMASLWNVDDESTSYLMTHFYGHLRGGAGRAEALRRAQKETRRKFPHPYQWAAFVLTGDGR
jgi:CHAT domain-containing protein